MLSTDLLRVTLKGSQLHARYVDTKSAAMEAMASTLIEVFTAHIGQRAGELKEALADVEGSSPRFKMLRGLAHLLYRRSDIVVDSPTDPVALRRVVFERSANARLATDAPWGETQRNALLEELAAEMSTDRATLERALYADLKENHTIIAFEEITPRALLHRYNVSLVQGILLRANRLELVVKHEGRESGARYRQFFRALKFHQLLHTITPLKEGGYGVVIDGPMSVLKHTQKYGFKMAAFFPVVLHSDHWRVRADVSWGTSRRPCTFSCSDADGLVAHTRERGVYTTEEMRFFLERFQNLETPWVVEMDDTIMPLGGQGVWIPDVRLRHMGDGRVAYLEMLGYWRADYLKRRMALLAAHGPKNLILAVSERLRVEKGDVDALPVEVIWFKKVLRARLVEEALDRIALSAPTPKIE